MVPNYVDRGYLGIPSSKNYRKIFEKRFLRKFCNLYGRIVDIQIESSVNKWKHKFYIFFENDVK